MRTPSKCMQPTKVAAVCIITRVNNAMIDSLYVPLERLLCQVPRTDQYWRNYGSNWKLADCRIIGCGLQSNGIDT